MNIERKKLKNVFTCRRVMRAMQGLLDVLSASVVKTPGLFAAMVLALTAVPWVHYLWIHPGKVSPISATVQMLSAAAVWAWVALAVYLLLKKWNRWAAGVWLVLSFVPLTVNWLIDIVLMVVYEKFFSVDIAAVIVGSNPDEAANFISAYGSIEGLLYLLGSIALFVVAYFAFSITKRFVPRLLRQPLKVVAALMILAATCCMAFMPESEVTKTNICGKYKTFVEGDYGHEIVTSNVGIVADASKAPQKVVVIIGESLSRSHCSVYGYEKQTQPYLESLVSDSSMVVFDQPTAPALHTIEVFKYIIGTWNGEADRNWYECPTFLEIARRSGYRLSWISNQSPKGVYDNPVKKIADYCDRLYFTGDGMNGSAGMNKSDGKDGLLIPMTQKWIDDVKDLSVIHLMGSHVAYHLRYPKEYDKFFTSDYDRPTKRERSVLKCYDNSVLYNDMVVHSLMKMYDGQDAVVIYFSDHAQDMFESDSHYFGHGRDNVPASVTAAAAIPMMVYMTPEFRAKHPDTEAYIRDVATRPFNTSGLTDMLMKIMHTNFTK